MIEEAIRKFAQENFSHRYFPVLHGETDKIQPFAVVVKKHRSIFKKPFAKSEIVILARFERYVEKGAQKRVCQSISSKIRDEELSEKQRIDMGSRAEEFDISLAGYAGATIKLNDDKGVLALGKLSQKYIDDPDLRGILANAELDTNKMDSFAENDKLLLVTSVIYSEKFELKGERIHQTERAIEMGNLPPYLQFLNLNGTSAIRVSGKHTYIPPDAAARNTQAPILFKCCRVEYNKETNRLEICKGEYVGKVVTTQRDMDAPCSEEETEYDDILVEATDQTDLPDSLTAKDIERLDNITKIVLLPEKTTAQRKVLVSKYLHWFEEALMTDKKILNLDEPMTLKDCAFLGSVYLPCGEGSTELDVTSFTTAEIQDFAIVFKVLDELPDEQWKELETSAACPD